MSEFDEVIKGYSETETTVEKDKTAKVIEAVVLIIVLAVCLLLGALLVVALITALVWFIVAAWGAILG